MLCYTTKQAIDAGAKAQVVLQVPAKAGANEGTRLVQETIAGLHAGRCMSPIP